MSGRIRNAFENGGGGELRHKENAPPKMKALHSSGALAANFFSYWENKDKIPLVSVLETDVSVVESLDFEVPFRTVLGGTAPHLDVVMWPASGRVVAIESKFTEWLSRPNSKFVTSYFHGGLGRWAEIGLPKCQALAKDLYQDQVTFDYLYVKQLLTHTLGLATQLGRDAFSLYYLYYDWCCEESKNHEKEIKRFAEIVKGDLEFVPLTYQEVYKRLKESGEAEPEYLKYLRERYFCGKGAPK